jgi:Rrf2 family transcriptional regulator, nitric oxide-sensitive transcriptional repressor
MNLSAFSDYALRILIYLAVSEESTASAQRVADRYGISFHHVAKVAQWLAREGYVVSTRGRGGGMILARPAHDITIGEVIRKIESGTQVVECVQSSGGHCAILGGCGLRGILWSAREDFFRALDKKTLLDAVGAKDRVARALQIPKPADGPKRKATVQA